MSGLDDNRLNPKINRPFVIISLMMVLLVGWNYWLPTAEDYFNMQTKIDRPPNVDFLVFYTAGGRFGREENPYYWQNYEPQAQDYSDYIYPPTLLPFYYQLSKLNYEKARHLWLLLYSVSYLAALLGFLITIKKNHRSLFIILALTLTTASYPLLSHIRIGQSDVLVSSISLLGFVAYLRKHKIISVILFALATLIKVSPIFFLIFFVIFLRDYRFLLYFCLASGVSILFSTLIVPVELYWDYLSNILPVVSGGTAYWHNQSILKFIAFDPRLARIVSAAGFGIFLLFTWFLRKRIPSHNRKLGSIVGERGFIAEAHFLINVLVMLIFVGKAWSMAYVWTILPSAFLLTFFLGERSKPWYLTLLGFAVFLLTAKVYGFPVLDSLNLIGNMILLSGLVIFLIKREWVMENGFVRP